MIKLVIKEPQEGEFKTICEREYDQAQFQMPEAKNVVTIPGDTDEEGEETRYYVQNIIHHLGEDQPEVHLVVQNEEEVIRQMRQQRAQMQQMQKLQQMAQGGGQGGNPFSQKGNSGQGGSPFGGGGGNPFSK